MLETFLVFFKVRRHYLFLLWFTDSNLFLFPPRISLYLLNAKKSINKDTQNKKIREEIIMTK